MPFGATRELSQLLGRDSLEPQEYIEAGDQVVVIARLVGRGKASGVEVTRTWAYVWTLRAGRALRMEDTQTEQKPSKPQVTAIVADRIRRCSRSRSCPACGAGPRLTLTGMRRPRPGARGTGTRTLALCSTSCQMPWRSSILCFQPMIAVSSCSGWTQDRGSCGQRSHDDPLAPTRPRGARAALQVDDVKGVERNPSGDQAVSPAGSGRDHVLAAGGRDACRR